MIPYKAICAACQREPDVITNSDGELEVVCRGCGQRDNLEEAKRIAGEHLLQQATPHIQDAISRGVGNSKVMKFEAKPLPKRDFRWHAEVL